MKVNGLLKLVPKHIRLLFCRRYLLIAIFSTLILSACSEGGGISSDASSAPVAVLTSIEITPPDPSIAVGTTQRFVATGVYSNGSNSDITPLVAWRSSDDGVATVSNDSGSEGLTTSKATGVAMIAAEVNGVNGSTKLTVTPAVLASLEITPSNSSIALGTDEQFTATGTYTDATTQDLTTEVTWHSSADTIATVSNDAGSEGRLTSVAVGDVTVSAELNGVSISKQLTVTPAALVSLAITPSIPKIALGTTQQFTATGTYTDTTTQDLTTAVTWSSSDTGIGEISNATGSEGLAVGDGLGVVTISADLNGVSTSTELTVSDSTLVSLAITPVDPSIALGTTKQFNATGTYTDGHSQDLTAAVT